MAYATLLFEVRDHVAHVTLNRPESANALTHQMARDLMDVMLRCDSDRDVRAVLVTGAGKAFCAGGDLKSFAAQEAQIGAHVKEVTTYLHVAISAMARMDAPVLAAVNGVAAGAGMSLACACDLVVAAESARFTMAYTRAGLTPDGSSTYYLPRLVGLKRALDLTLTNRMLSAREAEEWGIVSRVVPDGELAERAGALARELAAGPTSGLGAAKRLLWTGWNETLETQMARESDTIAARTRSADAQEGIHAFLEKRPPRFTGE
jgi:2-(1,2-epoxy-1,2-dihydrophenyl)acetyl-CoA isomerase